MTMTAAATVTAKVPPPAQAQRRGQGMGTGITTKGTRDAHTSRAFLSCVFFFLFLLFLTLNIYYRQIDYEPPSSGTKGQEKEGRGSRRVSSP